MLLWTRQTWYKSNPFVSIDGRPFEVLSEEEKEHRIAEVASRLKLIGDKAVERYNTESSSSGLESPQGQGPTARAGEFWDILNLIVL